MRKIIVIIVGLPIMAFAYTEEHRIEKDDRYYLYYMSNPDERSKFQTEEARLNNMMLREMRDNDNRITRKNNAELECIRKGDSYDVCREKYGY